MNTDLIMLFTEGFVFIGEPIDPPLGVSKPFVTVLKNTVQVDTVNVMDQRGLMPLTVMKKIGDVEVQLSNYPHAKLDIKSELYRDYVKLTTGIEVPNLTSH